MKILLILQDHNENAITVVINGLRQDSGLWCTYFTDFVSLKLRLENSKGIGLKLLEAYFPSADSQDPLSMFVLLHSYFNVHNLSLAKLATLMRPLDRVQEVSNL